MELHKRTAVAIMVSAIIGTILAFTVRGFGQLVVGYDLALRVAAPLFGVAFVLAVLTFCLAVLAKCGVISID